MSKRDIVSYAFINNSPIQFSWSCYRNEDIPCEECDSCKLRERGFKLAGYIDPIIN